MLKETLREKLMDSKGWVPVVIVLSFLFAGIYNLFASSGANLPAYIENAPPEASQAELPPPETFDFADEEHGYSVKVPDGWRKVTRQGHTTFVNQDGASLQIQLIGYLPSLNMVTTTTISSDIVAAGGVLEDFAWIGNDAYVVAYSYKDTIYMEYCTWSLSAAIRLQFVVPTESYSDYYSTMLYVFDHFRWDKADPIPEGFAMYYNEFGNFEFGLPAHWSGAVTSSGVYAATNPQAGSVMYVSVVETDATFHSVGQTEYVGIMSENRQNFVLRSFTNDGTSIMAEAVYRVGEAEYALIQLRKCNGRFQYAFSFECPMASVDQEIGSFRTAVGLFRFFS